MYTFSNRLKVFAIVLVILGAIGVVSGFISSHKSLEDVKVMLVEEASHGSEHVDATHEVVASDTHEEGSELHETTEGSNDHADSGNTITEHSNDEHAEHVLHQNS